MRSTFHGLNIANMGLFMSQKQIDVTSHNISNANTVGYSRQRYVTSAVDPRGYMNQISPLGRGQVGGGVEPLSLDQIRDKFLDVQYRTESSKSAYWSTRSETLYYIEDIFNGVEGTGLDTVISEFFNSVQEVSKNATDEAVRTNVLAQGKKMIEAFHMYHDQLVDLRGQQNSNMVTQVKHINEMLERMASLNDNILKFEMCGNIANDLRDERNLLLDELSTFMDITYTETSFEPQIFNIYGTEMTQLNVYVGSNIGEGYEDFLLVSHTTANLLDAEEEIDDVNDTTDQNDEVVVSNVLRLGTGVEFNSEDIEGLSTGILLSYLNMRDGNTAENQGIPYFLQQLDLLVSTFVDSFNSIHSGGYTMPTDSSASRLGGDFFTGDKAGNIAISQDIIDSVFNIAISSEVVTIDENGDMQTGNNLVALEIIKQLKETGMDDIGTFQNFFKTFLGNLASEVSLGNNMRDAQQVLIVSIETQRNSIMSVSEDEEMTELIRFQHAYNSAARCITVMDEALDKLINGTGRVGL